MANKQIMDDAQIQRALNDAVGFGVRRIEWISDPHGELIMSITDNRSRVLHVRTSAVGSWVEVENA